MIRPKLQHLQTTLYSKKWTIVASPPYSSKNYGILVYNMKERSIHYYPNQNAVLTFADLRSIVVLMEAALEEQTKLTTN